MQPKQTIAYSALLVSLAACASQHAAKAGHHDTTKASRDSVQLGANRPERVDPWSTTTELELRRRASNILGSRLLDVRCATLSCTLEVAQGQPMNSLMQWLRDNWSFRWKLEGSSPGDADRGPWHVTLYRHPADVTSAPGGGYSSLKGSNRDPCAQGADCGHPNWDEPHVCERSPAECPSIDFNGSRWCFENLQIACACAKQQGPQLERQLPGCNEEGYPY